MLLAITVLLGFQLAGEALSQALGIAVPGPVIGLVFLAVMLAFSPRLRMIVEPTANGLLRHLSLLFVPAAVGVMQQLPRLRAEGVAIGAAVVVSTLAAMAVAALAFRATARLTGMGDDR